MTISFILNDVPADADAPQELPLLWYLRDVLGLTGTKFGCGMGLCGACTVHIDGQVARSCLTPLSAVAGKRVTTIEALMADDSHALLQAWLEHNVPQCGYCQSGQLMGAAALLTRNAAPSDAEIVATMSAHVCRCGTYPRIIEAIHRASELARDAAIDDAP